MDNSDFCWQMFLYSLVIVACAILGALVGVGVAVLLGKI